MFARSDENRVGTSNSIHLTQLHLPYAGFPTKQKARKNAYRIFPRFSLDSAKFEVPFVRPAWSGNARTAIFEHRLAFLSPLRFIRVIRAIRGKNAILFLTADCTDFTDKVAGKETPEA